jgi:glutathione synthase/RimK-type ligase-like ATP-grasp enzyme
VNSINTLIISDSRDFTSDYICIELEKRKQQYLRIDKDKFATYKIQLDVNNLKMTLIKNGVGFVIDEHNLKSVYYRAPTYLRETFSKAISPEEQLYTSQWMAFIRNLTIFENAVWMNNPIDSYKAENKLFQLKYAKQIGFEIPRTYVVNYWEQKSMTVGRLLVKSLDTVLLKVGSQEGFAYSSVISENKLNECDLSISPVILQNYIEPKIDIRVTVVGNIAYSVEITKSGQGVEGDWRKYKKEVDFIPIVLPEDIKSKCIELVKQLGLNFGGIDLIKSNDYYFFIEINPTGEWAWLVNSSNLLIYEGICDFLAS